MTDTSLFGRCGILYENILSLCVYFSVFAGTAFLLHRLIDRSQSAPSYYPLTGLFPFFSLSIYITLVI